MTGIRRQVRVVLALTAAAAINIGLAAPVAAAIGGAVNPSQGRPGDQTTLQTGDASRPNSGLIGQTRGVYLISASDLDKQVSRFGRQVCGTAGQHELGAFTWKGGVGTLTFRIPEVPAGQYFFQVQIRNVSPDCWRIGNNAGGPLILMVTGSAASNPGANLPAGPLLYAMLVLVALGLVVILTAVTARLTRLHSSPTPAPTSSYQLLGSAAQILKR